MQMPLSRLFSHNPPTGGATFSPSGGEGLKPRLAAAVVAICLVSALIAWLNFDKSQTYLRNVFAEKGKTLLLALEGGVRSGKRTTSGLRFQYFLEELLDKEAVRFIAVTMPDGTIIAHTDPNRIGEMLNAGKREISAADLRHLAPSPQPQWVEMDIEGGPTFVIYREFRPRDAKTLRRDHESPAPYVFLGLDTRPLKQARQLDQRKALFYGSGVMLFGLLLVGLVYAWNRVQVSRQSQREAEALVDELALTLPDGLVLLDPKGRVTGLNESAQRLLQLEDKTAQGAEALLTSLPPQVRELAESLLNTTTLEDTQVCLEREGRPLYLSVRGGHVGDADNRLGSLMLLRDVSEVRRLEAEVRRREKLAAVGNLAAGVAHELRNPLSSIKGYATFFSERFPEGSDEREAAKVMVRETDRLNRTITDLIGLARPTDIRVCPTSLARLLEDAERLLRQDAEARHVHMTLDCAPDMPPVPVDPDRLRQVLLNLCLNALDAMPHGGELTLRLHEEIAAGIPQAVIEVSDTGTGIVPEHLAHVFDPYFTTKGHGTGLGLATVHKIMEAHEGSVAVSSVPGQGTTFRLCFGSRVHSNSEE